MTTTTTTARTFTAEGETFTTASKARFAVVLTCSAPVYCDDRGYHVLGSEAGAVVVAKRTGNYNTAVKALARYAAETGFVSGTIADTFETAPVAEVVEAAETVEVAPVAAPAPAAPARKVPTMTCAEAAAKIAAAGHADRTPERIATGGDELINVSTVNAIIESFDLYR